MLVITFVVCTFTIALFFMAGRVRKSYEPQHRTKIEKICIAAGVLGVITFGCILIYKNLIMYAIPRVLLLISICIYVYFKRKKKCCVPFWKSIKATIIAYIICFDVDVVSDIVMDYEISGMTIEAESIFSVGIICFAIMILLIVLLNKIFSRILSRRRVSSFYY